MSGRVDEAFAAWAHAAQLNPRHAEVHHKMAVALFQLGRKDEAVAECTEAIKLDPQHVKAHRKQWLGSPRRRPVSIARIRFNPATASMP